MAKQFFTGKLLAGKFLASVYWYERSRGSGFVDSPTLSLRGSAPDAMIDPVVECVFQAL